MSIWILNIDIVKWMVNPDGTNMQQQMNATTVINPASVYWCATNKIATQATHNVG